MTDEPQGTPPKFSRWHPFNFAVWGGCLLIAVFFATQLARLPKEGWIVLGTLGIMCIVATWAEPKKGQSIFKKAMYWIFCGVPAAVMLLAAVLYAVYLLGMLPIMLVKNFDKVAYGIGSTVLGLFILFVVYLVGWLCWHLLLHRRRRPFSTDCPFC